MLVIELVILNFQLCVLSFNLLMFSRHILKLVILLVELSCQGSIFRCQHAYLLKLIFAILHPVLRVGGPLGSGLPARLLIGIASAWNFPRCLLI